MKARKYLPLLLLILLLLPNRILAKGNARIVTHGFDTAPGVAATALGHTSQSVSQEPLEAKNALLPSEVTFASIGYSSASSSDMASSLPAYAPPVPPAPCVRRKFGGSTYDPRYCGSNQAPRQPPANQPSNGSGPRRGRRPPPPSPEQLAQIAADQAVSLAPDPQLRLAPGRVGLTGLDSYFWLADEPQPITARAGVPGISVVAEARPVQFVWNFGDGEDKVTSDSGRPWNPRQAGSIAHMYEIRGRYEVEVEVVWEARWRLGSGAWQSLGYFSNSDAIDYPVRQVVALLVPPG